MKRILVFIAALFLTLGIMKSIAQADVVDLMPVCYAKGAIYFEVGSDTVRGYIGNQSVELYRYETFIYGKIQDLEVRVNYFGDHTLKGSIGSTSIKWYISPKGNIIYGYQPCVRF